MFKKKHYSNCIRFSIEENGIEYVQAYTRRFEEKPLSELLKTNKPLFYFYSFGVSESRFLRKGYGKKLLRYIISYYRCCVIVLQVSSIGKMTNEQLINFYEKNGFKRIYPEDYTQQYPLMIFDNDK